MNHNPIAYVSKHPALIKNPSGLFIEKNNE